jgi:Phycobilisome protein
MVSTITQESTMTGNPFSPEVLALIKKARIVSFSTWPDSHPPILLELFQAADDRRLYLTNEELQQVAELLPERAENLPIAAQLRDAVVEIVNEARAEVLASFPEILQPGGGLYPAERADACWRDFWHFLRCITYGLAGERSDYLSADGLHHLNLLYQELQVPLAAMVVGLKGIKTASLIRIPADRHAALTGYFDELIAKLEQFGPSQN